MFRPETSQSFTEPLQVSSSDEQEVVQSFVGLVLNSMVQFRLEMVVDPEGGDDFGRFYRLYLDDFEVWSLDLQARLAVAFGISEDGTGGCGPGR